MSKSKSVGGQALIEGIMMRGKKTAMAVRLVNREIDITYFETKPLKNKHKIFGAVLIRGVVNMVESLMVGYKALMLSAEKSGFTELEENEKPISNKALKTLMNVISVVGVVLGVVLGVFLFMWVPSFLFDLLSGAVPADISRLKPLFEGILKIGVFITYVALVSKMKDIQRVFKYHGAEHKTIFCYENDEELTVENIKKYSRFHPRCGTSFLIITLIVSIFISFLLTTFVPALTNPSFRLYWVIIKILIVPLMCGVSYELIKICSRYDNRFTKIISAPGLWLQRLTVKEPEDDMLEIAAAALKAAENEGEPLDDDKTSL